MLGSSRWLSYLWKINSVVVQDNEISHDPFTIILKKLPINLYHLYLGMSITGQMMSLKLEMLFTVTLKKQLLVWNVWQLSFYIHQWMKRTILLLGVIGFGNISPLTLGSSTTVI